MLRQFLDEMRELRDAKWLSDIAQRVFRNNAGLLLAKDEADGWLVIWMTQHVIDCGEVEVHLPGILRFECTHLQIDHDVAPEFQVVEEQVNSEIFTAYFERNLIADEGEAHAEFDKELTKMCKEFPFEVALMSVLGEGKEIEVVDTRSIVQVALAQLPRPATPPLKPSYT